MGEENSFRRKDNCWKYHSEAVEKRIPFLRCLPGKAGQSKIARLAVKYIDHLEKMLLHYQTTLVKNGLEMEPDAPSLFDFKDTVIREPWFARRNEPHFDEPFDRDIFEGALNGEVRYLKQLPWFKDGEETAEETIEKEATEELDTEQKADEDKEEDIDNHSQIEEYSEEMPLLEAESDTSDNIQQNSNVSSSSSKSNQHSDSGFSSLLERCNNSANEPIATGKVLLTEAYAPITTKRTRKPVNRIYGNRIQPSRKKKKMTVLRNVQFFVPFPKKNDPSTESSQPVSQTTHNTDTPIDQSSVHPSFSDSSSALDFAPAPESNFGFDVFHTSWPNASDVFAPFSTEFELPPTQTRESSSAIHPLAPNSSPARHNYSSFSYPNYSFDNTAPIYPTTSSPVRSVQYDFNYVFDPPLSPVLNSDNTPLPSDYLDMSSVAPRPVPSSKFETVNSHFPSYNPRFGQSTSTASATEPYTSNSYYPTSSQEYLRTPDQAMYNNYLNKFNLVEQSNNVPDSSLQPLELNK